MKRYVGTVRDMDWSVTVDGNPLPTRTDLCNHSPDGFAWGYGGSGPAQLALAILADATDNDQVALACYQSYKSQVIAGLDKDKGWEMTQGQVLDWAADHSAAFHARRGRDLAWSTDDVEVHR